MPCSFPEVGQTVGCCLNPLHIFEPGPPQTREKQLDHPASYASSEKQSIRLSSLLVLGHLTPQATSELLSNRSQTDRECQTQQALGPIIDWSLNASNINYTCKAVRSTWSERRVLYRQASDKQLSAVWHQPWGGDYLVFMIVSASLTQHAP